MAAGSLTTDEPARRRSRLRLVIELVVSLTALVILFRAFLAGGYLIETGSMAPCLLGYHWSVTCPACQYNFAVEGKSPGGRATCPNCGKGGLAVESGVRNEGDHLLVSRSAFAWRAPRRWEVVVFRNPNKPTQAYVKRLAGLPGEVVEIRQGDLYVDGVIQTKDYQTQCGMRIPVYDHDYRPDRDDPDWQPRWVNDAQEGGWTFDAGRFAYSGDRNDSADDEFRWVTYRHWIRRGGWHRTSVALERWPESVPLPTPGAGPLEYDAPTGKLICHGALSRSTRDELLREQTNREFRDAIERLYEASHIAPIADTCGYNRGRDGGGNHEVRDLMISMDVRAGDRASVFAVELSDGVEVLRCTVDTKAQEVRLLDTKTGKTVRMTALSGSAAGGTYRLEFSLMDRQALVAVNGEPAFDPWSYPAPADRGPTPWRPVRWGARGGPVEVGLVRLYRDVYYTSPERLDARPAKFTLGRDEYFVLGDNSPVSRDSRAWSAETVLRSELFLGRPMVVHLPSRHKKFVVGPWQMQIRIPEPSRIRYIH